MPWGIAGPQRLVIQILGGSGHFLGRPIVLLQPVMEATNARAKALESKPV